MKPEAEVAAHQREVETAVDLAMGQAVCCRAKAGGQVCIVGNHLGREVKKAKGRATNLFSNMASSISIGVILVATLCVHLAMAACDCKDAPPQKVGNCTTA